ncbi:MAG TPA: hypothetical protein VMH30_13460 [Verrucomicrobiae bacterium]|nr:hypothetical protein [Verrucomicrobiae bacterium]
MSAEQFSPAGRAKWIRAQMPSSGLFAGLNWRISPAPFPLGKDLAGEIESLGRVLLQFYRAVNLLYRKSVESKQPEWVSRWLDLGKPRELIELQRSPAFKNDVPRVIRPDILLTENSFSITELDSVPGGIGLTAWLQQTYSEIGRREPKVYCTNSVVGDAGIRKSLDKMQKIPERPVLIGIRDEMVRGFESIFDGAKNIHIIISEEAATYRPEMEWLAGQISSAKVAVRGPQFEDFAGGDAAYRFFELFDLGNVPNSKKIFEMASAKEILLTPPPKPIFEEKMLFALFWNRHLQNFWRQELGEGFFARLKKIIPYTWLVDPAPLPPQGAIPELNLTDWQQLKSFSQRERELVLKISGFSEKAWGARGVFLGSDLSHEDWANAVDNAISVFEKSPFVLQRFERPKLVDADWFDFEKNELRVMKGRARLCPYYFVSGRGDAARPQLGGVLATIVPADKKIVHGMSEAILAPCAL